MCDLRAAFFLTTLILYSVLFYCWHIPSIAPLVNEFLSFQNLHDFPLALIACFACSLLFTLPNINEICRLVFSAVNMRENLFHRAYLCGKIVKSWNIFCQISVFRYATSINLFRRLYHYSTMHDIDGGVSFINKALPCASWCYYSKRKKKKNRGWYN